MTDDLVNAASRVKFYTDKMLGERCDSVTGCVMNKGHEGACYHYIFCDKELFGSDFRCRGRLDHSGPCWNSR